MNRQCFFNSIRQVLLHIWFKSKRIHKFLDTEIFTPSIRNDIEDVIISHPLLFSQALFQGLLDFS